MDDNDLHDGLTAADDPISTEATVFNVPAGLLGIAFPGMQTS
jgi:hypothetical protein